MKTYTFTVTCFDWDEKTKKRKVSAQGKNREDALMQAMIDVSNSKEFEKFAQVEMYGRTLIDNI